MKNIVAMAIVALSAGAAMAQQPTTGTGLGAATYQQLAEKYPAKLLDIRLDASAANDKATKEQKWDERQQAFKAQPVVAKEVQQAFSDPAAIEQLEIEVGKLHAAHFTPEELKELEAFYRTPIGAKLLAKMPTLTASSAALAEKIAMPKIVQILAKNRTPK